MRDITCLHCLYVGHYLEFDIEPEPNTFDDDGEEMVYEWETVCPQCGKTLFVVVDCQLTFEVTAVSTAEKGGLSHADG